MQVRRVGWSVILGLALAGEAACGGGGDGGISQASVDTFEGVYLLVSATENPSACDVEGPSVLDTITQQQFVVIGTTVLGTTVLQVISCSDDADCASKATAVRAGSGAGWEWGATLSEQRAPEELGGFLATTGFNENGVCTRREYTDFSWSIYRQTLARLEARVTALADRPAEDGICWVNGGEQRAEAAGRPCTSLKVFIASQRGPLP
jgi:hypothetical protein